MSYEPITSEQFISEIDNWIVEGGSFPDFGYRDVETLAEAEAVIRALKIGDVGYSKLPGGLAPNIHNIAALLQSNKEEVFDYFRNYAAEHLRVHINEALQTKAPESHRNSASNKARKAYQKTADGYLFALQALIRFGHLKDIDLLITAARKTGFNNQYFWSSIFRHAQRNQPNPETILNALRDPLPERFCRLAYLDFANALCFENRAHQHPFNTEEGFEYLLQLTEQTDIGYDSYVISAVNASPYLSQRNSDALLKVIRHHEFKHVRPEADWAAARRGDENGIRFLRDKFQSIQFHTRAASYFSALNMPTPVLNIQNKDQFKALVAYSDWMADEQEFYGHPPEKIEVIDQFNVVWPEPDNSIPFWLVTYDTRDFEDDTHTARMKGVSLVSPIGFSRFFEKDDKLSAFCEAVEFDQNYKPLVEKWPARDWCAQRLNELNPDLFERKSSIFRKIFR